MVRWIHYLGSAITSGQAVFPSRAVPLFGFCSLAGLQDMLHNYSWSTGASDCAPQLDGAAGWTPCSGRVTGQASQSDRASGCALCDQAGPQAVLHCWEMLPAGLSGWVGPLTVPSSWVGLETALWSGWVSVCAPWLSGTSGYALQLGGFTVWPACLAKPQAVHSNQAWP